MCPISDIRPGAMVGLAVVTLRLTKLIRFVTDSHYLFTSSIVPPFYFKSVLSLAITISFAIAIIMLQLITAPDSRILLIILITFSSISSGKSFDWPLFFRGRAMKSTSGLSACYCFNDFTNSETVDSETPYFFAVERAPWETACFATSHRIINPF